VAELPSVGPSGSGLAVIPGATTPAAPSAGWTPGLWPYLLAVVVVSGLAVAGAFVIVRRRSSRGT
jgi:hypothetical protein